MTAPTISTDRLLLTVTGPEGSLDVRVPATMAADDLLAEVLPSVVDSADRHDRAGSWRLSNGVGTVLAGGVALGLCGIADGDTVYVEEDSAWSGGRHRQGGPATSPATATFWDGSARRTLVTVWAAGMLTTLAVLVAVVGRPRPGIASELLLAGIAAAGVGGTATRRGWPGAEAGLVPSLGLAAIGGWGLLGAGHGAPAATLAGIAAALLTVAVAVATSGPKGRKLQTGIAAALILPGVVLGAQATVGAGGLGSAAAYVAAAAAVAVLTLPRLAIFLAGADRPDAGSDRESAGRDLASNDDEVAASVGIARGLLLALIAAVAVDSVAAWVVLTAADGIPAVAVVALAAGLLALRTRHHRNRLEVAVLAAAALTGLTVAAVGLALRLPASRQGAAAVTAVLVVVIATVTIGAMAGLPAIGYGGRRVLRKVEVGLRLILIPAALWAAGVLGQVSTGSAHLTHVL